MKGKGIRTRDYVCKDAEDKENRDGQGSSREFGRRGRSERE